MTRFGTSPAEAGFFSAHSRESRIEYRESRIENRESRIEWRGSDSRGAVAFDGLLAGQHHFAVGRSLRDREQIEPRRITEGESLRDSQKNAAKLRASALERRTYSRKPDIFTTSPRPTLNAALPREWRKGVRHQKPEPPEGCFASFSCLTPFRRSSADRRLCRLPKTSTLFVRPRPLHHPALTVRSLQRVARAKIQWSVSHA